jgi:uncharacterized protein (DUF58 family)
MNSLSSPTTRPDKPTKITSQAAGYLLNWPGLIAMAAILVLAAWNGQAPIVVLTRLLFSAAGLAKLWSHLSIARISCRRQLSERRVFAGEKISVKLQVVSLEKLKKAL